jgi:four helix bundle protein
LEVGEESRIMEDGTENQNKPGPAKSFIDLVVWQKAHKLVLSIYALTTQFPTHEQYCLTVQLKRAAVSIPANIAEGFRRKGKADKLKFFNIAEASLNECHYYFILAEDLKYCKSCKHIENLNTVSKLLAGYTRAINSSR